MNRKLIFIAWLALALPALAAVAQETSARTVQYHSQDIVPIHANGSINSKLMRGPQNDGSPARSRASETGEEGPMRPLPPD
jgi:hypothetical protein